MKKLIFFIALFISAAISFAAEINADNYKRYIGKHLRFNPKAEASDVDLYKIGPKKFKNKKYSGVVLKIGNIEPDKKGNLILFLEQKLENGKTDKIKVKVKSPQIALENIIVVEDEEAKRKARAARLAAASQTKSKNASTAPRNADINYADESFGGGLFFLFIIGVFMVAIIIFIRNKNKDRELLETVTTRPIKGHIGAAAERDLVLKLLKFGLPSETIFHDLYLRKPDGNFSQIDVVAVTEAGIIVFEVKDYSGWIFGNGKQSQWTQVLAYGKKKFRFYNPIMQNNWHIKALRKQLGQFGNIPFYSVIVFFGDCELKDITFVPEGTFIVKGRRVLDVIGQIINKTPVHYLNKEEVLNKLKTAVKNGDDAGTQDKHIENVKDMLGKDRIFR